MKSLKLLTSDARLLRHFLKSNGAKWKTAFQTLRRANVIERRLDTEWIDAPCLYSIVEIIG